MSLGGDLPAYVDQKRAAEVRADEAVLGLFLQSSEDGKRMAYLPAVPAVDDRLLSMLESCDLVLFDGTFLTDDELVRVQGGCRSALQMGHLPISGQEGSLARLAKLRRPHKVFVHINNTNPFWTETARSIDTCGKRVGKLRRMDGNSNCGSRNSRLSPFERR